VIDVNGERIVTGEPSGVALIGDVDLDRPAATLVGTPMPLAQAAKTPSHANHRASERTA